MISISVVDLPEPDSPTSARVSPTNLERHVVDGRDLADGTAEHATTGQREVLDQVVDLQRHRALVARDVGPVGGKQVGHGNTSVYFMFLSMISCSRRQEAR